MGELTNSPSGLGMDHISSAGVPIVAFFPLDGMLKYTPIVFTMLQLKCEMIFMEFVLPESFVENGN